MANVCDLRSRRPLRVRPFSLGVTYDVNVSSLQSASENRGGIEVSLIYIKKPSNGRHGVPCPRF